MNTEQLEGLRKFQALGFCAFLAGFFSLQYFYNFNPGYMAFESEWWKFFTSIFGHSGLEHLTNNLFFLGLFGTVYERLTSGRMFFATFLVSALFANLSAFIFFTDSFIIGASGGAMGILAALAVYRPNQIGLALGVPLPMWAVLLIYVLINTAGLTGVNNVAYEAHLFGMVTGAVLGYRIRNRSFLGLDDRELEEEDQWHERIRRWEEKWMMD